MAKCTKCKRECLESFRLKKGYQEEDNYHLIPKRKDGKVVFKVVCNGCFKWDDDRKFCRDCGVTKPSNEWKAGYEEDYAPLCKSCNEMREDSCSHSSIPETSYESCKKCSLCPLRVSPLSTDYLQEYKYHNIPHKGIYCEKCFLNDKIGIYCVKCGTTTPKHGWLMFCEYNYNNLCIECYILNNIYLSHGEEALSLLDFECRKCKKTCIEMFNEKEKDDDSYHMKRSKKDKNKLHIYCQECLKWTEKKPFCVLCGLRRPKSGWVNKEKISNIFFNIDSQRMCNNCFNSLPKYSL